MITITLTNEQAYSLLRAMNAPEAAQPQDRDNNMRVTTAILSAIVAELNAFREDAMQMEVTINGRGFNFKANTDDPLRGTVTLNGQRYHYGCVLNLMDDDICREMEVEELTPQQVVDAYLPRHLAKFGEEFRVN